MNKCKNDKNKGGNRTNNIERVLIILVAVVIFSILLLVCIKKLHKEVPEEVLVETNNNEYELKIHQVDYYGNELIVQYSVQSEEFINSTEKAVMAYPKILIDGLNKDLEQDLIEYEVLDKNTYLLKTCWDLSEMEINNEIEVEFILTTLTEYELVSNSEWLEHKCDLECTFVCGRENDEEPVIRKDLDIQLPVSESVNMNLTALYSSEFRTRIEVSLTGELNNNYCLKGNDDLGNEVFFAMDKVNSFYLAAADDLSNTEEKVIESVFYLKESQSLHENGKIDKAASYLELQLCEYQMKLRYSDMAVDEKSITPVGDSFTIELTDESR